MNWKKIIAGTLILGAGAIIYTYFQRQAELLYKSCIKLSGVKKMKASFAEVSMTILLDYNNKSDITLTLVKQQYEIYISGFLASTIKSDVKAKVLSHQTATLSLDVKFNPKDLLIAGLKNIEQLLLDKEKITIEIRGKITVESGIIFYSDLPFSDKMTIGELMHPVGNTEPC